MQTMQEEHRASSRPSTSADGARLLAGPGTGVASNDYTAADENEEENEDDMEWEENEDESKNDSESDDGASRRIVKRRSGSGPRARTGAKRGGSGGAGSAAVRAPCQIHPRSASWSLIRSLKKMYVRWLVQTRTLK